MSTPSRCRLVREIHLPRSITRSAAVMEPPTNTNTPSGRNARAYSPAERFATTSTMRSYGLTRAREVRLPVVEHVVRAQGAAARPACSALSTAVTAAPIALASWMPIVPTPPPAPLKRTLCPGFTSPP